MNKEYGAFVPLEEYKELLLAKERLEQMNVDYESFSKEAKEFHDKLAKVEEELKEPVDKQKAMIELQNLYQQLEEPEGKDGIWVKTDESFKNIIADKFLTTFPSLNLIDLEENTEVKLLNEIP